MLLSIVNNFTLSTMEMIKYAFSTEELILLPLLLNFTAKATIVASFTLLVTKECYLYTVCIVCFLGLVQCIV